MTRTMLITAMWLALVLFAGLNRTPAADAPAHALLTLRPNGEECAQSTSRQRKVLRQNAKKHRRNGKAEIK